MSTRTAATRRKEAESAAYGLLADKVATVTSLAELGAEVDTAAGRVTTAQTALADVQERYAQLYRTARAAGWSVSDLASAGCDQERAGAALRSRPRTRTRASDGATAAADVPSPTPPRDPDSGDSESSGPPAPAATDAGQPE